MERADAADVPERALLRGRGEEILVLVVKESTTPQLTEWLRLPLELSPAEAAFLLERDQCCQFRRKGEELLGVVMSRASDEQWCKWLQIPLEHALLAGKALLVEPLLAAGAGLAGAVVRRDNGGGGNGSSNSGSAAGKGAAAATASVRGCDTSSAASSSSSSSSSCSSSSCCPERLAVSPSCSCDADQAAAAAADSSAGAAGSASSCCPDSTPAPSPASPVVAVEVSSSSSLPCYRSRGAAAFTGCGGAGTAVPAVPSCAASPSPSPCNGNGNGSSSSGCRTRGGGGGGAPSLDCEMDNLSLHRATMARDSARMLELLAAGVDRNATDLWSCTALHRAAEQAEGSAEHVRLLLAAGLDVRAKDMEGYTPLHFAAARGAETAIVDLLAAGSCLAERGINGDTPLHSAVRFLSLATVRILLESDADEGAVNGDGHTPLDVTGVLPDGRDIENQPDPLVAEGIKALLKAAPQQRKTRTWKRRGWIVMLRARRQAQAALELAEAARTGCLVVVRDEVKVDVSVNVSAAAAVAAAGGDGDADTAEFCGGGRGGGESCGERGENGCDVVVAEGCDVGGGEAAATEEDGGFSELVEQTTLLAEEGVFQKVVEFL